MVSADAYSATALHTPELRMRHSASNTVGSPYQTSSGTALGAVTACGVNSGNSFAESAVLRVYQDGNAGVSGVPGRMEFQTGDGSGAVAARMTIKADGSVGIGVTSPAEKLEVSGNIKFGTQGVKISTGTGDPSGGSDADIYVRKNGANTKLCVNVNGTWMKCSLTSL